MSVPTYTGPTLLDNAESTTGWTAWGANKNKFTNQSEVYLQGGASNRVIYNVTGLGGMSYTSVGGVDATTNLFWFWVYAVSKAQHQAFASGGLFARLGTGTNPEANYEDYYVGGSDIAWVGQGWHLVVVDANRTADASSGTFTKTNVGHCGIGFNNTAVTASQAPSLFIDSMFYGTHVEVTGPSLGTGVSIDINSGGTIDRNDAGSFITDGWEVGDFVKITGSATAANDGVWEITGVAAGTLTTGETFTQDTANTSILLLASVTLEDIYTNDMTVPATQNFYGAVVKDPNGAYSINLPLIIGDQSGSNDVFFLSRGDSVVLADQPLDDGTGSLDQKEDYIVTAEDTGETHVMFGNSDGTGNDRVGFAGSVVTGQETVFTSGTLRGIDFSEEITSLELYGSTFVACDAGIVFAPTATDHRITNTTFNNCGQIQASGAEVRGSIFTGYSGTDGALLWDKNIDIRDTQFLANANAAGTAQAIEHAASGTYDYTGLTFSGNDYDIHFSATTGDLIINATDSDPTTSDNDSVGTVTINNSVNLTIKVVDESNTAIQDAQVAIYYLGTQLMNEDTNVSGIAQESYNYSGDISVSIRIRKGSSADSPKYLPTNSTQTVTSDGLSLTFTLIEDTNNNS